MNLGDEAGGRDKRRAFAVPYVDYNIINDAGVEALARALPQMAHLTTLNLSSTTYPALCGLIA